MTSDEAAEKSITDSENGAESDAEKDIRRKAKLETNLTSGCGFGRKKQELIDFFWSTVWSGLEKQGWTKVGSRNYFNSQKT